MANRAGSLMGNNSSLNDTQKGLISAASSTDDVLGSGGGVVGNQQVGVATAAAANGDVYWPKLTPSSPKLKVTFNEVTSTSDDVLLIGDQEQTDGKR